MLYCLIIGVNISPYPVLIPVAPYEYWLKRK